MINSKVIGVDNGYPATYERVGHLSQIMGRMSGRNSSKVGYKFRGWLSADYIRSRPEGSFGPLFSSVWSQGLTEHHVLRSEWRPDISADIITIV